MADPLDEYRKKRDFAVTPEPMPAAPQSRAGNTFVVHRHEARGTTAKAEAWGAEVGHALRKLAGPDFLK